jgi:phospholipid/cholesterol/gamma-HCH transport system substrate-binding protein
MRTRHTRVRRPPRYRLAGTFGFIAVALVAALVWCQFRGMFIPTTQLTVIAARAGLAMDPGSKVTYNGAAIGRVADVQEIDIDGVPKARLKVDIDPRYVGAMPANVDAGIQASTVFGPKYVAFKTPKNPVAQRISSGQTIDASSVTTEINTLFETVTSIAEKVDPIKLNQTLSALAQALDGLGDRFGQAIVKGNAILDDLNPQLPQIRYDIQRLGDLADVYADASPDLWAFLKNAVTTAGTLNGQQADLDAALTAAIGFGNTSADVFERSGPFLIRGQADLVSTTQLLDKYSPELFCTIRNLHDLAPVAKDVISGNGYGIKSWARVYGASNPYVYPDNLPRVNAKGGPGGRPGCWSPISRNLWPAPHLVMDTGASIAPYNHLGLGQPLAMEYIWGRQIGENTINP